MPSGGLRPPDPRPAGHSWGATREPPGSSQGQPAGRKHVTLFSRHCRRVGRQAQGYLEVGAGVASEQNRQRMESASGCQIPGRGSRKEVSCSRAGSGQLWAGGWQEGGPYRTPPGQSFTSPGPPAFPLSTEGQGRSPQPCALKWTLLHSLCLPESRHKPSPPGRTGFTPSTGDAEHPWPLCTPFPPSPGPQGPRARNPEGGSRCHMLCQKQREHHLASWPLFSQPLAQGLWGGGEAGAGRPSEDLPTAQQDSSPVRPHQGTPRRCLHARPPGRALF